MSLEGGGRQRHALLPVGSCVQGTVAASLMTGGLFPIFQGGVASAGESCSLSKWGCSSLITIRKDGCSVAAKGCGRAETSSGASMVRPCGFCGMVLAGDNRG